MVAHRIVCTTQEPADKPLHDAHIVSVGIGSGVGQSRRLSMADVYSAMDRGETFYTVGPRSGRQAQVRKWACKASNCRRSTLKSDPDGVGDNNLDELPRC